MAANANVPPADPPAMAATGTLLSACWEAEGVVDVVPVAAMLNVASVASLVEVLDVLDTNVEPPVAWYAIFWSSRFRIAGSRSPSGQPDCAHGLVLQQPQKVSECRQ